MEREIQNIIVRTPNCPRSKEGGDLIVAIFYVLLFFFIFFPPIQSQTKD